MFTLELLPRYDITSEDTPSGRFYTTPDGVFPSVTTVLGAHYKKDLSKWIDRVGKEQAEYITKRAGDNGNRIHDIAEKFLLNENYLNVSSIDRMRFGSVQEKLQKHVSVVYGCELPLWNRELVTAGRTDSIVNWDGKISILDFKTTINFKNKEWILSYFVQASTYALMANALYNLNIDQIVILFSQDDFSSYYYVESLQNYKKEISKIFYENISKELKQGYDKSQGI